MNSHIQRRHSTGNTSELEVVEATVDGEEDNIIDSEMLQLDVEDPSPGFLAKKSSALFLLTMKERYKLTQSAVDFSLLQIRQMFHYVLDDVKTAVIEKLGDSVGDLELDDCF